ncbi:hypothetical protein ACHAQA_004810 [Verticillium albo-atrum]
MASGYSHSPASTAVGGGSSPYSYPSQYSDGQQQQQQQQQMQEQYNSGLMATADYQGGSGLMAAKDYPDVRPGAETGAIHDDSHSGYPQESHAAPAATSAIAAKEDRICGLRRVTFWLVMLSAILAAGLIGAAAAAGVMASKNSNDGSGGSVAAGACSSVPVASASASASASVSGSASASASASTTTGASTTSASDFTAIPIPTQASAGLGVTDPGCPGVNGTEFEVPGTDLVFERICGVNYPGNDIGMLPMTRMDDCLLLCASQNISPQGAAGSCLGVVWGYGGRQGTNAAFCWLKFGKTDGEVAEDTETAWLVPK